MQLHRLAKRANKGPGGIKCPCCRIGPLRYAKRLSNRLVRRVLGRQLRRELNEEN